MKISKTIRAWVPYIVSAWAAALLVGGYLFTGYSLDAQTSLRAVEHWPASSRLPVYDNEFHAVIFVHPKCVCSRSTLVELKRALGRSKTVPNISCVFYCPADHDPKWAQDELWELAQGVQKSARIIDLDGEEAKKFGVQISGHVMLFGRSNEQIYSGGITSARGHEGDNLGGMMLSAFLDGENPSGIQPPPFGCRLFQASDLKQAGG